MSKKGESIIKAIRYLDSFYEDLGLMFGNLEKLLSEKGFISIPNAGNTAAYIYNTSSHIGYSWKWTLKNIQRLYLEESLIKSHDIDSALICNASFYKTSLFNFPVLTCGILKWNDKYSTDSIYNRWDCNSICNIVCDNSIWRFKEEHKKEDLIYHLIPSEEFKNYKSLSVFFLDLIRIENSEVLQAIVNALIDAYHENYDISLDEELVVNRIPPKLLDNWSRPIIQEDEQ